ncbi:MAG: (E)-4-hydroxy-3-methylbut-2-enyl-diphosphate synthase [bacterium]|nr:(E)-4-hydroxy-3-methylbut-2-enyl-diphosphate synthase [bacterium]
MVDRYTQDVFTARRRPTREVRVGDVGIGGANPLRVQSMTNTDTRDVRATVGQIEQLAQVGCEIVRLTVPSIRDAEVLPEIRAGLTKRGITLPLVADIHFTPNAAMLAAQHVEKVRINPGNYVDKKKSEVRESSDAEVAAEIERVAERFRPLVLRCKQRGVAMRIGTNHGSLSDRIMNRFGDTPLGMVESALEFLDVCEAENYHDIVFSMKASNTQVAIQAYRLLAQRLDARLQPPGGSYPFHVGITEAGDAEDGRIKSAIGIGALLEDGLGDTIRVSLTEHPVREIPVACALAARAQARWAADRERETIRVDAVFTPDPYRHQRRATRETALGPSRFGGQAPVRVELDLGALPSQGLAGWAEARAKSLARLGDVACESIRVSLARADDLSDLAGARRVLREAGLVQPLAVQLEAEGEFVLPGADVVDRWIVPLTSTSPTAGVCALARAVATAGVALEWELRGELCELPKLVDRALEFSREVGHDALVFSCAVDRANHGARLLAARLSERGAGEWPIVLRFCARAGSDTDCVTLDAAIDLGAPLCDGIGDMVSLASAGDPDRATDLAYRVLQGARLRTTRTEFISCPSCGRTLFDLEEVTARIKSKTEHLKGLKIAIMGCIVNGPGEMADADFGYVGSGPGKVTLYVGKQVVARSVDEDQAPGRLIELIKDAGRCVEPA